jgi:hypothetical protein
MMSDYSAWQQQLGDLKQQLEQALALQEPDFDPTQLQTLFEQYHQQMISGTDFAHDFPDYGVFLQQHLDWIGEAMTTLTLTQEKFAADLLLLQRRKKAEVGYNQNS